MNMDIDKPRRNKPATCIPELAVNELRPESNLRHHILDAAILYQKSHTRNSLKMPPGPLIRQDQPAVDNR